MTMTWVKVSLGIKMRCRERAGLYTRGLETLSVPAGKEASFYLEKQGISIVVSAKNAQCVSTQPIFDEGRGTMRIFTPVEEPQSFAFLHNGRMYILTVEFVFDAEGPPKHERIVAAPLKRARWGRR